MAWVYNILENGKGGRMYHSLETRLEQYQINTSLYPHDQLAFYAVEEALTSLKEGNFGVGAVIATMDGDLLVKGRNHMFHPRFNSMLHAEMDAINQFEELGYHKNYKPEDVMLITSLEPCMMCLGRLLYSTIGHIYWMSQDLENGSTPLLEHLPQVCQTFCKTKHINPTKCSNELVQLAHDIFYASEKELDQKLYNSIVE